MINVVLATVGTIQDVMLTQILHNVEPIPMEPTHVILMLVFIAMLKLLDVQQNLNSEFREMLLRFNHWTILIAGLLNKLQHVNIKCIVDVEEVVNSMLVTEFGINR